MYVHVPWLYGQLNRKRPFCDQAILDRWRSNQHGPQWFLGNDQKAPPTPTREDKRRKTEDILKHKQNTFLKFHMTYDKFTKQNGKFTNSILVEVTCKFEFIIAS